MTFFLLFYSVFFQAEQGVAGPVCGRQASKEEPVWYKSTLVIWWMVKRAEHCNYFEDGLMVLLLTQFSVAFFQYSGC